MHALFLLAGLLSVEEPQQASAEEPRWATLPALRAMPRAKRRGETAVDDARIAYAVFGSGDPVVLLHGGLGNAEHWANQVPALAKRFTVVVIDTRGHGRSTRTETPIAYDTMASDVLAVLDALELPHASFVGFSDGGETALRLAMRVPARVQRVVVLGVGFDPTNAKAPGAGRATIKAYQALCRKDYARLSPTPTDFAGLLQWLLPMWRAPTELSVDKLGAISAPVLVATGDHDEFVRLEHVRDLAAAIPHARLRVFDDASHFVMWQDGKTLNAALLAFLSGADE